MAVRRLGRSEADVLAMYLRLPVDRGSASDLLRIAKRLGPLGLCREHDLPVCHLPDWALRQVQRRLDTLAEPLGGDDDDVWWAIDTCDRPSRARTTVLRTGRAKGTAVLAQESVEGWRRWAEVLYGINTVAWRIQVNKPATAEALLRLQPLVDTPVEHLLRSHPSFVEASAADDPHRDVPLVNFSEGTSRAMVVIRHPLTGAQVSVPLALGAKASILLAERQRRIEAALDDQRRLHEAALHRLIALVDLRARVEWEGSAARLTYGGGTGLGALVAQLTLRIGGHNALAVCDLCRVTWDPERTGWPRAGPRDGTYCPAHSNPADRRRHRRRVGSGQTA